MTDVDREKFPIEKDDCFITNLQVCKSAAGFFIGRHCWDKEYDMEEPYSRETGYYATREEAEKDLKELSFTVRDCIENRHAYATGYLPHPKAN